MPCAEGDDWHQLQTLTTQELPRAGGGNRREPASATGRDTLGTGTSLHAAPQERSRREREREAKWRETKSHHNTFSLSFRRTRVHSAPTRPRQKHTYCITQPVLVSHLVLPFELVLGTRSQVLLQLHRSFCVWRSVCCAAGRRWPCSVSARRCLRAGRRRWAMPAEVDGGPRPRCFLLACFGMVLEVLGCFGGLND